MKINVVFFNFFLYILGSKKIEEMLLKDYMSEINSPSVYNGTELTELTTPMIEEYITALEEKRHDFLISISDKRNGVIKAYISELTNTKQEILKLGFIDNVDTSDLINCSKCDDEIGGICSMFLNLHILYKGIIASIDRTYSFLSAALDDTIEQPEQREIADKKTEVEPQQLKTYSEWLTVDEVCKIYGLPKNNIKDKKWRDKKGFPTYQTEPCASVRFYRKTVEEWLQGQKC